MQTFLIFDMDGVIVDSNPFHKQAWQAFCNEHGLSLDDEEMERFVYGKTNPDALAYVYGGRLSDDEVVRLTARKEAHFRELIREHLQPLAGLTEFLSIAERLFEKPAVATSAPTDNVDFTLDTLGIRDRFALITDQNMVSRGKPDPEIFLTTARRLNAPPERCIVFEDSLAGLQAARAAGMTVVGLTTTHSIEELQPLADLLVPDFTGLAKDPSPLTRAVEKRLAQSPDS